MLVDLAILEGVLIFSFKSTNTFHDKMTSTNDIPSINSFSNFSFISLKIFESLTIIVDLLKCLFNEINI